jgi:hypothetical protein
VIRVPALLMLTLGMLLTPTAASAQSGGPPLLPIIYDGTVYLDGALVSDRRELTVRVGDWESNPALVQEGQFQLLIAGPPDSTYDGALITFWLDGLQASQQFTFTDMPEPKTETLRLDFTTAQPDPTATPLTTGAVPSGGEDDENGGLPLWAWVALVVAGLGMAGGLAVWRPGVSR